MAKPPPLTTKQMQHYERNAAELREIVKLQDHESFNPFNYLDDFKLIVKFPDEVDISPEDLRAEVGQHTAKDWSGMSRVLQNGKLFVLLNRNQTTERMNVTLLEEIAHRHYGHTYNVVSDKGREKFDKKQEQEAYFTAAAALLPASIVAKSVFKKEDPLIITAKFGASIELYEMRIKTLQHWSSYSKYKVKYEKEV